MSPIRGIHLEFIIILDHQKIACRPAPQLRRRSAGIMGGRALVAWRDENGIRPGEHCLVKNQPAAVNRQPGDVAGALLQDVPQIGIDRSSITTRRSGETRSWATRYSAFWAPSVPGSLRRAVMPRQGRLREQI